MYTAHLLYIYFNSSIFFLLFSFLTNIYIVSIWCTIYIVILTCTPHEISGRKLSMSLLCDPGQQNGNQRRSTTIEKSSTWSSQFNSPFSLLSPLTTSQSSFGSSSSVSSFTKPSYSSSWNVINPFARNHKDIRIRHTPHVTHRRLFSRIRVPGITHRSDHKQNLCNMIQHPTVNKPTARDPTINSQSLAAIFKHNHVNTFVNLVIQPYDSKDPRIKGKKIRLNKVFSFKDSF